ncbi:hypothetical protein BKP45_11705 [Anaerobacillus alkalidiazotrophicus]|uniref:RDD domain-containing protein n=1 Tax=Anaerobacillus alkalidiazotrophicus TaxID=472963 RepID=A0A1S2M197_9BACI|nr:RDD family protein [Anaerobacillus alkalidiazotrophicus]OIJ18243.1 hypothetical protein BKP45_17420 [Anaerobacillus alkalidiazotrophicus]OIJ19722.1 hypothetical protein BKP45_11705 [Anaerobacillus alkalidiazotrophicus]
MDEQHLEQKVTIEKEEKNYRYAGFWMRFWAYLLDLVVVASINGIVVTSVLSMLGLSNVRIAFFSIEAVLIAFVTALYFLLLTKKWGQTIGKKVFGIKVVHVNNKPLTWSSVIFREVVGRYILQVFILTYFLYLIVAFQKKKQGLHDMVGDTYVIHEEI